MICPICGNDRTPEHEERVPYHNERNTMELRYPDEQDPSLEELFSILEGKLRAIDASRVSAEAQLEKLEEELEEVRAEVRNAVSPRMIVAEHVLREASDVVIVAAMLVRSYGFSWNELYSAVQQKMVRNARRTWIAHNGTARHIDEVGS